MFWRNSVTGAIEAVARDRHLGRAQRRPARQRLTDETAASSPPKTSAGGPWRLEEVGQAMTDIS